MLPSDLREQLPDELVEAYDLERLFAGEVNGVLSWVVIQLRQVWYGPLVGPLFSDSVLSTWQRYDPTQYVTPEA